MTTTPKPVVLCILDGWGHRDEVDHNAIKQAATPNWDRLWADCPHAMFQTSGEAVGLPEGQMGNSEVGHMNLGGGRVVMQDLPRIDAAFKAGELTSMPAFMDLVTKTKAGSGTVHLIGLLSPGGVHSHQDQMVHMAKELSKQGLKVKIHAFLDGRDTPPQSAHGFVETFEAAIKDTDGVEIAVASGRYYAMDRDKRWDRVEKAYNAMVLTKGERASSAKTAIEAAYARGETDEFIAPTVIGDFEGMQDGDGVLMANFRADRAREIMQALADPAFDGFERTPINFADVAGLVEYSTSHNAYMSTLFAPLEVKDGLGEVVSRLGLKQLRISETEKYAHVTFFFNGGEETPFEGEDRILVPSPDVATYDLQPEMSAPEVTAKLVEAINSNTYDLIIVNFANADMVGHTGIMSAAIKACETVDTSIGQLAEAIENAGGVMLITADHGNIEHMHDAENLAPHTQHTTTDVPAILVNAGDVGLNDGRLADVAPTLLALMHQPQPAAMTGRSLLARTGKDA